MLPQNTQPHGTLSLPPVYVGRYCFILYVCLSVCSVYNFECLDTETSFLKWLNIIVTSRSSLSIKVILSGQGHCIKMGFLSCWISNSFAVTILWFEYCLQDHFEVSIISKSNYKCFDLELS